MRITEFEKIFRRYQPMLVAYANQMLRSTEDAKEVVQDVFVSVWKNRDHIRLDGLKSYLYTATRNKCLNFIQKKKLPTVPINIAAIDANTEVDSAEAMEAMELRTILFEEVQQLPKKCKAIFLLSRQEGLSHKEIANQLGISEKTVENQIGIALKRLRKRLQEYRHPGSSALISIILLFIFGGSTWLNGIIM